MRLITPFDLRTPFPFPPLEKNEPSKQRAKCVRLSGTIIATVLSSLPYVPFLLAFQQLLSYQNFAASRKGWWESAKTRWWNQPWWFLSLRGSLANCFHSPQSCTIIYNRRSSASFQSAQNSVHTRVHTESLRIWIFMPKIIIFCWIFLNCIVDFWREN